MTKGLAFYENGEKIEGYLLVKSVSKATASNGKLYLTLFLQDKTGEIETKLWDANEEVEKTYKPQTIVKIAGTVEDYRGKLQLKLRQIRPAIEQDGYKLADFLETAPLTKDELMDEMAKYMFEIKNETFQQITRHLLKKYQHLFYDYPAATKNHHEFISGLAYHVVSMLHLAKAITGLYPSLDKDLLYSAIILHDLGKVVELSGPISTSYTTEGTLLGHITIIVNEIGKAAEQLKLHGEEVVVLQHVVLAHHGKLEFGSPKTPLIKEAEVLHYIDNLDARMNMIERAMLKTKPGEFTDKIFPLENRSFYKPTFHV